MSDILKLVPLVTESPSHIIPQWLLLLQDLTVGPLRVQFNHRRPGTVAGICRGVTSGQLLAPGEHEIGLMVGECEGFLESYEVLTGYNSVSRFIIEEIPDQDAACGQ